MLESSKTCRYVNDVDLLELNHNKEKRNYRTGNAKDCRSV
jgi:hypothetical protein